MVHSMEMILLLFPKENLCYQISPYLMATAKKHQPKHKICCTTYLLMLHESGRKERKKNTTHKVPLVWGIIFLLLVFK